MLLPINTTINKSPPTHCQIHRSQSNQHSRQDVPPVMRIVRDARHWAVGSPAESHKVNQEDEGIKVCLTKALLKVPRCKQGMMEGHCRVSRWKGPPRLACIKFTKLLVGAFKFVDKFPGKEDLNGFFCNSPHSLTLWYSWPSYPVYKCQRKSAWGPRKCSERSLLKLSRASEEYVPPWLYRRHPDWTPCPACSLCRCEMLGGRTA